MKMLLLVIGTAGLMITAGLYATDQTDTNTAAVIDWTFTGDKITGANVTWTPNRAGSYQIALTVAGTTGTSSTPGTVVAGLRRTDHIIVGPAEVVSVSGANLVTRPN